MDSDRKKGKPVLEGVWCGMSGMSPRYLSGRCSVKYTEKYKEVFCVCSWHPEASP